MADVGPADRLGRPRHRPPRRRGVRRRRREPDRAGARAGRARRSSARESVVWTNELAVSEARRLADARPDSDDRQHPGLGVPALHDARGARAARARCCCSRTSTRSTRAWSGCSPPPARSTRSAARTAAPGATSAIPAVLRAARRADPRRRGRAAPARLDVRPDRRPPDGDVHRRVATPTTGSSSSASTSRRSTSGRSCAAPPTVDGARVTRRPRVARAARRRRPLRRQAAHAGAARAPDPLLLRRCAQLIDEWNLDFCGIKGAAGADRQLRDDGRHRGVPQRPVRLGRPEGADRLLDRGRHGRAR